MKYLFILLACTFALSACKKKQLQADKEDEEIQKYLTDHGLTATKSTSGLCVVITNPGTGSACTGTSTVTVDYKGYYTNGTVFDESGSAGATFNLQSVIKGWTEGIPYFKEGGEGILLVPSRLGYGENGNSSIPGNTILIFDVKLLDVG